MNEHLMSKKHMEMVAIQNNMFATEEDQLGRKRKGRPEKAPTDDSKQRQIDQFFTTGNFKKSKEATQSGT
jgi:hypothetical protein